MSFLVSSMWCSAACLVLMVQVSLALSPLRLSSPLPAMDQFASSGPQKVVTAYHIPTGIAEATRIASAEALANNTEPGDKERPDLMIVGGLASFRGEHPFMAGLVISLTSGETSVCGGSLVSPARVLTAAACYWDGYSQAYSILVVLGSVTLFSGGTRVSASSIAVHSSYSPASIHYNLAVLSIPYQASSTYVKPIALSYSGEYVGTRAEAIGFGRTSDSAAITSAASMRDVYVNVISNSECQLYYGTQVSAAEMCSSGAGGRNPCGGDQGGPLIIYSSAGNDLLLGVFTFGSASGCSAGAPAGYQRVAYFWTWIQAQL